MEEILKYVKDNDIKSYLSWGIDKEKLKEYINLEDYKEQKENDLRIETIEDYIGDKIMQYNYQITLENEDIEQMINLINGCEFDLEINENGKLDLIDLQGVYLGGNYENFETIAYALERLSYSYLYDYYGIE